LAKVRNAHNLAIAAIPVERISGRVLLISGDDDKLWPSSPMAESIQQRLRRFGRAFCGRWLRYGKAGHEIGEAYGVSSKSTIARSPRYDIALGGSPNGNASASADSWFKVIAFLETATRPASPASRRKQDRCGKR
jgi:hypothetical protein